MVTNGLKESDKVVWTGHNPNYVGRILSTDDGNGNLIIEVSGEYGTSYVVHVPESEVIAYKNI